MEKIRLKYSGLISLLIPAFFTFSDLSARSLQKDTVIIQYSPGHPANRFVPAQIIGGAVDGHEQGDIDEMLIPANIREMLKTGLGPVSYRLRTELAGEVWHWNPKGKWSDEQHHQGYWISDSVSETPIRLSHGYRLPRRGNTFDQANNDGYSRIDDGDTTTFWKSNPYLSEYFTGEPDTLHPQWVIVDLGSSRLVNAIRIRWGNPFAATFHIAYAGDIGNDYFDPFEPGLWHSVAGAINSENDQDKPVVFSKSPVVARFIRVTLDGSTYTGAPVKDIRDKLGYAIRELEIGEVDRKGKFHDLMCHAPENSRQSTIYVSSTDPWHRVSDEDPDVEQMGIDRFFSSGITRGLPVLMPSGLLYDTPGNMVNLLRYMKAKKYPVEEMEMGEEPEGQRVSPEDYAALYCLWAHRLLKVMPALHFGGPGFAAISFTRNDGGAFTEADWTKIFLNYLQAHHAAALFNFFSFEWYPFDDICAAPAPQLAAAPQMLRRAVSNIRQVLHSGIPIYMTEYGYSAYAGRAEVKITGALMYADILGQFLTLGGEKNFLYGYEPAWLETNGCGYGNNMMLELMDDPEKAVYRTAAFYGMRMLTRHWLQPGHVPLEIYPAFFRTPARQHHPLITAYALLLPGGKWSLMLINKDPFKAHATTLQVINTASGRKAMLHPGRLIQYSRSQYHWKDSGEKGHPILDLPPVEKKLTGSPVLYLPPYSLTIVTE